MKASSQLFLLGTFLAASVVFAKTAELALVPAHYAALCTFGRALINNVVIQAGLITATLVGLVSMCALAWDRAERRYQERTK